MRILYAIQGTGNGHLSRAKDVIPALKNRAQVDILVSGQQADIDLPFEIKYRYKGLSFIFGKKGGIDFWLTFKRNQTFKLLKEIISCPVKEYDLVINDFEPVSAWAAKIKGVSCVSLSHQSALLSNKVPKPSRKSIIGKFILKYYAPAKTKYGFHFKKYDTNIFTPIIRQDVRDLEVNDLGHYTVYLPAYSDEKIVKVLHLIPDTKFHVFSKHCKHAYNSENVSIEPINGTLFSESMANATGVLCGAGFETPAEAMYLNKKLMVIPMQNQFEQHYNAESLKDFNVAILPKLKVKQVKKIKRWIKKAQPINLFYPNQTQYIIDRLLEDYIRETTVQEINEKHYVNLGF
jgi:uncharacterized protein (TIGR00661 family)